MSGQTKILTNIRLDKAVLVRDPQMGGPSFLRVRMIVTHGPECGKEIDGNIEISKVQDVVEEPPSHRASKDR